MNNFITDRSVLDVKNGTDKGFYQAADFNRVGEGLLAAAALLVPYGYYPELMVKTDWQVGALPTQTQLARYLKNIKNMASTFAAPNNLPLSMSRLDYRGANAIEETLALVPKLLPGLDAALRSSGTLYSGEESI